MSELSEKFKLNSTDIEDMNNSIKNNVRCSWMFSLELNRVKDNTVSVLFCFTVPRVRSDDENYNSKKADP